ncbi:hypothetical protein EDD15DRAFT_756740 [Pisolithus albus]|nr:hypothetical protein EDD15DRAFT_756740 [Pisolithus albus]
MQRRTCRALASVWLGWITPGISRAWFLPHTFLSPATFGLDDVVLEFAVVLPRTRMPLETRPRAIEIRLPHC